MLHIPSPDSTEGLDCSLVSARGLAQEEETSVGEDTSEPGSRVWLSAEGRVGLGRPKCSRRLRENVSWTNGSHVEGEGVLGLMVGTVSTLKALTYRIFLLDFKSLVNCERTKMERVETQIQ